MLFADEMFIFGWAWCGCTLGGERAPDRPNTPRADGAAMGRNVEKGIVHAPHGGCTMDFVSAAALCKKIRKIKTTLNITLIECGVRFGEKPAGASLQPRVK